MYYIEDITMRKSYKDRQLERARRKAKYAREMRRIEREERRAEMGFDPLELLWAVTGCLGFIGMVAYLYFNI